MHAPNVSLTLEAKGAVRPYCVTSLPDSATGRVKHHETCTYCHNPMADGGAPMPVGMRLLGERACATCHDRFRRGLPLITRPTSRKPHPVCDHGVPFEEDCSRCDMAILETPIDEIVDCTLEVID